MSGNVAGRSVPAERRTRGDPVLSAQDRAAIGRLEPKQLAPRLVPSVGTRRALASTDARPTRTAYRGRKTRGGTPHPPSSGHRCVLQTALPAMLDGAVFPRSDGSSR